MRTALKAMMRLNPTIRQNPKRNETAGMADAGNGERSSVQESMVAGFGSYTHGPQPGVSSRFSHSQRFGTVFRTGRPPKNSLTGATPGVRI
jgi:hypothetical protein